LLVLFFFFQAEDGIRDFHVTGVQTCALPISERSLPWPCLLVAPERRGRNDCRVRKCWLAPKPLWKHRYGPDAALDRHSSWEEVRSEERRVGKECRRGGEPEREKDNAAGTHN